MRSSFVDNTSFPSASTHRYSNTNAEGGRMVPPQMDFANEYGADGSWNPLVIGSAAATTAASGSALGSADPLLFLPPQPQTQPQAPPTLSDPPPQRPHTRPHQTSNIFANTAPAPTVSGNNARNAAPPSATQRLPVKREKETFLLFTRVALRYLEQKDPPMCARVKAVIKECLERSKRGDPGYQSITAAMKPRIQATLGDHHWKRAEAYFKHFMEKKRQEQGLGGAATQPNGIITTTDDFGGHRFFPIQASNNNDPLPLSSQWPPTTTSAIAVMCPAPATHPVPVRRVSVAAQTNQVRVAARPAANRRNSSNNPGAARSNPATSVPRAQALGSRSSHPGVVQNNPRQGRGQRALADVAQPPKRQRQQPRVQGPSKVELHNDKKQEDDDGPACVICEDHMPLCIALPCAHLKFCVACARKLCFGEEQAGGDQQGKPVGQVQCPVCRKDVTEMKRVYAD